MANTINHANRFSPFKSMGEINRQRGKEKGKSSPGKVGKDFDVSLTHDGKSFAAREAKGKTDVTIQKVPDQKWNVTPEEDKLSPKAKEYLEKLRQEYGDYEFLIADNVDNPLDIAGPSDKNYFVMLSSEEIERMAEDEEYANQVMGKVASGVNTLEEIQNSGELGEGVQFKRLGISFDEEGNIKLFAELERFTEKQEEIRKAAMEKAEEDKKLANRDHSKAPPQRPTVPTWQELTVAFKAYAVQSSYTAEKVMSLLQGDGTNAGGYNYTANTSQSSSYVNIEFEATLTTKVQEGFTNQSPHQIYGRPHHGHGAHHGRGNHGVPVQAEQDSVKPQQGNEAQQSNVVRLEAGSVEELIEKAKNIVWDE